MQEMGGDDEKNIRRRVYDALNVLMAMDIINKSQKDISWVGFGAAAGGGLDRLRQERLKCISELERKQNYLQVGYAMCSALFSFLMISL